MYYTIRHVTKFRYSEPITESVMEVRMQPRTENMQRCWNFELRTQPRSSVTRYTDELANSVHQFDVPDHHDHLTIRAESVVEVLPSPDLPDRLDSGAWGELDRMTATDEFWDDLTPSHFARPTELLLSLAQELRVARRDDPLTTLRVLNSAVHDTFEYDTTSTEVDSPIDHALQARRGVCQDFTHVLITLVRQIGIPCRYVSGYLFHRGAEGERSAPDATHAWAEAMLPSVGWIGMDPTNDLMVQDRHIRVAVGRDYADVPPTRGVFKGRADTELAVSVKVSRSETPPIELPEEPETEPRYHKTTDLERLSGRDLQEQPQ